MNTKYNNKNLEPATKQDLDKVVINLNKDIGSLGDEILERFEIVENELSSVKEDVSILKVDVSGLKADVSSIKEQLHNIDDKMATRFDRVIEKLQDMRDDDAVDLLQERRQEVTLKNHEKRIKAFENAKN